MKRLIFSTFLSFGLLGCGKDPGPDKTIVLEMPEPKEKSAPRLEAPAPQKEEPRIKLAPFDLRAYGFFALIDAPINPIIHQDATLAFSLFGPDGYSLTIKPGRADLPLIKKGLLKATQSVDKVHVDESDALFVEWDVAGKPHYRFQVNAVLSGKAAQVSGLSDGSITFNQAKRNFDAAKSLRQTPALAQAQREGEAAEAELLKRGVALNTLADGSRQALFFDAATFTDEDLEQLGRLPNVSQVVLRGRSKLTANGLLHLEGLPRLALLSVSGPWVNGSVVQKIGEFTALRELKISDAPITDYDLRAIANLTNLEDLNLEGVRVGDAGLKNLLPLTKLKYLTLSRTDVTDKGLAMLQEFSSLRELSLADTAITNAGLCELAALANLAQLDLKETIVDDAGLEALCALRSLWEIAHFRPNFKLEIATTKLPDEPAPVAARLPTPIDQLPPPNADALIQKWNAKIKRDDEAERKPIISIEVNGSKLADRDLAELRL